MGSITGSELLAKSLKAQGMDTLFYLMGGPMLETESACIKLGVRAIDSRHEQGAAMMAHAYSRLTRRPGVCMASSGPGTINMATGVANAFVDGAPLVAVGGTSPRIYFGMDAFQEVDQLSLYKPITKWATRILDAKRIPDVVATAFRQATSGRPGPVFLDLPGDAWVRWSRNRRCRCRPTGGPRPGPMAIPRRSPRRSRCSRAPSGP
jgi:acetolactate synthase-1/2/3 large subunit